MAFLLMLSDSVRHGMQHDSMPSNGHRKANRLLNASKTLIDLDCTGLEVGGQFSTEAARFLRARARACPFWLQATYTHRWTRLVAFAAQRALAASLLPLPLSGKEAVDGTRGGKRGWKKRHCSVKGIHKQMLDRCFKFPPPKFFFPPLIWCLAGSGTKLLTKCQKRRARNHPSNLLCFLGNLRSRRLEGYWIGSLVAYWIHVAMSSVLLLLSAFVKFFRRPRVAWLPTSLGFEDSFKGERLSMA